MRALVTGAGGFVGRNLTERLLRDGHEVHALIRPGSASWRLAGLDVQKEAVDVADAPGVDALWHRLRPEWVFHCAAHGAYSFETNAAEMARTNVVGIAALLMAASRHGCVSLVNAGSSSEYGDCDHAPRESDPLHPNSDYAITKAAATRLCQRAATERRIPVTTLRLYSAYGPWEDSRRLMPTLCRAAAERRLPPLAAPWTVRDFVYIDDVVDALVLAASSPAARGKIYNIGSGTQTSLERLVELAREEFAISEMPTWSSYNQRAWDTRVWVAQPERARRELGWEATTSLRSGMQRTASWFAARGERCATGDAAEQAAEH